MDKLLNWVKNLDLGSKISYGVLVLSIIICMLILSSRMNNPSKVTNLPATVTPTTVKTKTVTSDFDTKKGGGTVTPKLTSGVSSQIITPSKSLTITPTLKPTSIPTITPTLQPTSIPTITPTPQPTLIPTERPTPKPTISLLSKITLSANNVELYPGEKQQITVYFEPSNVIDKNISWTYNGNIVDITSSGLITAKQEGKTNVVVAGSNGKTTLLAITVKLTSSTTTPTPTTTSSVTLTPTPTPTQSSSDGLATGISVSPTSLDIDAGEQQQLTFSVIPSDATNPTLVWDYDGYIINMDEKGMVSGKNPGTTTITFKTSNNITETVSVIVRAKPTNTPTPTRKPTPTRVNKMALDSSKGALVCNQTSKVVGTNQCSSENAKISMNSHCSDHTLCANGCGLVSVSAILQGHNAKNTPKCLLTPSMGCKSSFFTGGGACPISWDSMSNTLIANLGKGALYNSGKKFKCTKKIVSEMLCKGWVLIVHIRRENGTGHWLVAAATTSTGDIALADSSFSDNKFNYWSNAVTGKTHPTYCLAVKAGSI